MNKKITFFLLFLACTSNPVEGNPTTIFFTSSNGSEIIDSSSSTSFIPTSSDSTESIMTYATENSTTVSTSGPIDSTFITTSSTSSISSSEFSSEESSSNESIVPTTESSSGGICYNNIFEDSEEICDDNYHFDFENATCEDCELNFISQPQLRCQSLFASCPDTCTQCGADALCIMISKNPGYEASSFQTGNLQANRGLIFFSTKYVDGVKQSNVYFPPNNTIQPTPDIKVIYADKAWFDVVNQPSPAIISVTCQLKP